MENPIFLAHDLACLERENARLKHAMHEAVKLLDAGNPHMANIILNQALKEDGE